MKPCTNLSKCKIKAYKVWMYVYCYSEQVIIFVMNFWLQDNTQGAKPHILGQVAYQDITRRFSNHESCLLLRSHTYAIIVILDLKIHQSMWIHWPFFPKTWIKGHWPLDDLWPHVCWGHMCDSTQGSLCPCPMGIHQCMWIQWSILQITTYIRVHQTPLISTPIFAPSLKVCHLSRK